ncbi:MAG: Gfo/Idh/MocA family protein [Shinella sp.]|uniref:Gfo/Idh/MocA family protein n=1 Tax=Shinella sp. TaxID=1870904 RepID=UPI0040374C9B
MSPSAADRIAVAVIGAGFIADYHINGLRAAGGADIAALVGRRPDATRARAQALSIGRAETDYRRVLEDSTIDAVVIATPDDTHERIAIDTLDAGKHVLLQKPMALNSAQCRSILQADQQAGRRLTVSFMHRYFPEVRWLCERLQSGALGTVHSARIRNATPGADWNDWFFTPGNVSGGVVMQLGVHGIDLVQHLLGPIRTVAADMTTARPERQLADGRTVRTELEDNVFAAYRLEGDVRVSHEMSYTELAGCDRFRLELYAERGTVWLRTERGRAAIHAPASVGKTGWVNPELPEEALGEAHHRHWLSIIRGETPPDDTAGAGLSSVRVAEAIYAAALSGMRTPIGEDGEKAGCA